MSIKEKYKVKSIKKELCKEWLLKKHYLRRMTSFTYSFGLYKKKYFSRNNNFRQRSSFNNEEVIIWRKVYGFSL